MEDMWPNVTIHGTSVLNLTDVICKYRFFICKYRFLVSQFIGEILIASYSSKIDLGWPGMTFSHYSAEENTTQSKLALMMTLPSATSPKKEDFFFSGMILIVKWYSH